LLRAKQALAEGRQIVLLRDYAKGISEFEKGRDLFAAAGDVCEAAIAENWAAQFLPDVAKIAEGRTRLNALIADAKARRFQILLSPAYYWLAVSDYQQDRLSDSNRNFKTALRLAEAGNNIFEAHHAADSLVQNDIKLGELEPALAHASKLLSFKGLYYQNRGQSLRDLGTLADLSLKLKFLATSLSFSREALSIARDISQPDSRLNSSLLRMVKSSAAKEDFDSALAYANESKRIALARGDSSENTRLTAEIYFALADLKRETSHCDEALPDYDKALELYARLPELSVSSYEIHKGKLFCFKQLNRPDDFSNELQIVLKLSEQYRNTIREDDSRQAFFANEQDVFDLAMANALEARDSQKAFELVEDSRARSLLDFVAADKPIAAVEKTFGTVTRPLLLAEIQARLPEQVQLVHYAVLPDKLAIWVVSKTRFDLIEKPIAAAELEKKVTDYQAAIIRKESRDTIEPRAKELYQLLIPSGLASDKQLCLVPDKSLHQLAFASLVSASGKYLLEEFALSYSPSASVFIVATENARQKSRVTNESLLSVGNPDFDREENPNLPDLSSAAAEAKEISGDYEKPRDLLGSEATKDKFLENFAQADVIHFAGHFVPNRQSPGNSKLLFAGGELRASELGAYKLARAKLVVLSACETGIERFDKSEGAIGIARTFLALGAPLVIASQWKVDSEPTRDLMIAFHHNRKEKKLTTTESLRQAQLEMLRNGPTQSPYYWAAFSLFGGYASY